MVGIGKRISHYQILEELGRGGMGVVYKAHDIKLDRDVAIKFLPRHITASAVDRERFTIEARAAAALNHPHIATIYSIEEVDGETFFVMECIDGQELKNRIQSAPLSVEEVVEIGRQIVDGLQAAHRKGIVHRDIKSSNIMLTGDGSVKIMDFGLAKVRGGSQVTKVGSTVGTVAYMSPEQARGEEVDNRSDLWSLGIVLYEMLSGRVPYVNEYEQAIVYSILNEDPKPIRSLRADVPEALASIVHHTLAKEKNARYSSADELLKELQTVRAMLHPADAGVRKLVSWRERFRRPRFAIPVGFAVLALAVLITLWFRHNAGVHWAREEALPGIERLTQDVAVGAHGLHAWSAFQIAEKTQEYIPDDPLLIRLLPSFSRTVRVYSHPSETRVYAKPYSDPETNWRYIGVTPIDSIRFPLGFTRVKLEKEGYHAAFDIVWNSSFFSDTLTYQLSEEGTVPSDMELLPNAASWFHLKAAPAGIHMPGLEHLEGVAVGSFLMDRYEVTNEAFKLFVDSGGYNKRDLWKYPFVSKGRALAWEEAMKLFVDKTGRPGPSTWEVGDYPDGKGDYPVTGVSWYEAAAYAEFIGKSLPTIYHWDRAAFAWASSVIVPASNLRGDGPKPVGASQSMNRFGIYELAGNAREWCFNENSCLGRFILGGGWNDPAYAFNDAYAQSPFDRS